MLYCYNNRRWIIPRPRHVTTDDVPATIPFAVCVDCKCEGTDLISVCAPPWKFQKPRYEKLVLLHNIAAFWKFARYSFAGRSLTNAVKKPQGCIHKR